MTNVSIRLPTARLPVLEETSALLQNLWEMYRDGVLGLLANSHATSNLSTVLSPVDWPCLASLVFALGSLHVFYVQGHTEPRYLDWIRL